ncbi:MAG: hypothetical protein MHM6MM_002635 [Cercozoa sp. M6MM]
MPLNFGGVTPHGDDPRKLDWSISLDEASRSMMVESDDDENVSLSPIQQRLSFSQQKLSRRKLFDSNSNSETNTPNSSRRGRSSQLTVQVSNRLRGLDTDSGSDMRAQSAHVPDLVAPPLRRMYSELDGSRSATPRVAPSSQNLSFGVATQTPVQTPSQTPVRRTRTKSRGARVFDGPLPPAFEEPVQSRSSMNMDNTIADVSINGSFGDVSAFSFGRQQSGASVSSVSHSSLLEEAPRKLLRRHGSLMDSKLLDSTVGSLEVSMLDEELDDLRTDLRTRLHKRHVRRNRRAIRLAQELAARPLQVTESLMQGAVLLGQGAFFDTYRVLVDGTVAFAVKRSRQPFGGHRDREHKRREMEIMTRLQEAQHTGGAEHIVRLFCSWQYRGFFFVMMELCDASLGALLSQLPAVSVEHVTSLDDSDQVPVPTLSVPAKRLALTWQVAEQVIRAIAHMHAASVLHLDLKPDNILVQRGDGCKLADFGSSLVVDRSVVDCANSTSVDWREMSIRVEDSESDSRYMAPEILESGRGNSAADIFAYGMVLLQVSTDLQPPASGVLWQQLRRGDPQQLPRSGHAPLDQLIARCLRRDPRERPTAQEVLHFVTTLARRPAAADFSWDSILPPPLMTSSGSASASESVRSSPMPPPL